MQNKDDNIPIKKVQPQPDPEASVESEDEETSQSSQKKSFMDRLRGVGKGIKQSFSGGFSGAKSAWFGAKPVTAAVSKAVGKGAQYFGVSKKAMAVTTAVVVGGTTIACGSGIANINHRNLLIKQDAYVDECYIDANESQNKAVTVSGEDDDAKQRKIAEKLWGFGKAAGMTDYQCAAMLGNYNQESGLDPCSIELITDGVSGIPGTKEPIRYTEDFAEFRNSKQYEYIPLVQDIANGSAHIGSGTFHGSQTMDMNLLVSKYTSISINVPAYTASESGQDGTPYWGIGLLQWTGPTAYNFLKFAQAVNAEHSEYDWISLEVQIAVLFKDGQKTRFDGFLADTGNANSVASATASWLGFMERGEGHAVFSGYEYENRLSYANHWYNLLAPSSASIAAQYSDLYNTVLSLANVATNEASAQHSNKLLSECNSEKVEDKTDNGDIAAAAVAYAWETKQLGMGNDGTALYREVHDTLFPGDGIYQSCDRGAATAIVWSGADDNFPVGDTTNQYNYCQSHGDIWDDLGTLNSVTEVQPGDVLLCPNGSRAGTQHGHILLFVGNDAVKEKYPNSDAMTVSASYCSRSPGCGDGGSGDGLACLMAAYGGDGNAYHVFRYKGTYDGAKKTAYNGSASGTSQ